MKKITDWVTIIILILILGSFFGKMMRRAVSDYMLRSNSVHTKAVIIDEKNYEPNNHVKFEFTYSYMFMVNGKEYTNNSHNRDAKIGDTVEIEYVKSWPSFNRALHKTD